VNLALHDVRHNLGRFAGTSLGVALLFTVVLAMAGIYQGLVDDATVLVRAAGADLWVVQQGTRGPFADVSRVDPSLEQRVAAAAGVRRARSFTYQVLQRDAAGASRRFALVGVSFPEDAGRAMPLVAGRPIAQARGELIADTTLGLPLGATVVLAREELRVVGLTKQLLGSGGDAVVLATIPDAQLVMDDAPTDAVRAERERRLERLRRTDLGRSTPALAGILGDPRWRAPALADPPLGAVLVDLEHPGSREAVRAQLATWPDVAVFTTAEEEQLLLDGVVEKPRKQLALFSMILVLTSSILIAAVVYMMTLDKARDIAVLKLMGAPSARIARMVLEQAWLMGAIGYAIAVAVGSQAFPHFPRRVVLTPASIAAVGALVMTVSTLASLLGVRYALRVDAGRALEG
jgi:putative ABC transport system permease protein